MGEGTFQVSQFTRQILAIPTEGGWLVAEKLTAATHIYSNEVNSDNVHEWNLISCSSCIDTKYYHDMIPVIEAYIASP